MYLTMTFEGLLATFVAGFIVGIWVTAYTINKARPIFTRKQSQ